MWYTGIMVSSKHSGKRIRVMADAWGLIDSVENPASRAAAKAWLGHVGAFLIMTRLGASDIASVALSATSLMTVSR